jgi:hypothetical protein
VEQVAGLADAVQEALVAELPAIWFGRSRLAPGVLIVSAKHDRQQLSIKHGRCLLFHLLGELDVEDLVLLAPQQHDFLQPRRTFELFFL